jgi:hypothetical protein
VLFKSLGLVATALVLSASVGLAQKFNIDIGPSTPFAVPSNVYGAASGQIGNWINVDTATAIAGAPLTDTNGSATSVTLTAVAATGFNIADFSFNNVNTTGNDEALLDDLCDSSTSTWTFSGLANGAYTVYVYAWAPDARTTFFSDVSVTGGTAGVVHCGGQQWSGTFSSPAFYMKDSVQVSNGTIVVNMANPVPVTPTSINGFQIVPANCGTSITYCVAKVNSLGCTPSISSTGTPSATAGSGFVVKAVNVLNNKNGLLFYGTTGQAATPFQGGTLCVKTPIRRTGAINSGGNPPPNDCSGQFSIDMNAFAVSPGPPIPLPALQIAGTVVNCQFWGRDPGFAAPNNTTLTNAIEYTICP